MEQLPKQVIFELNYCINTFENYLGVEIKNKPQLETSNSRTSAYNLSKNTLLIDSSNFGEGVAYFEEISHLFRENIMPSDGKELDNRVQEFFGRLGEEIGKELTKGTEFEYLFQNYKPREFSNPQFFESEYGKYIKNQAVYDLYANFFEDVVNNMQKYHSVLSTLTNQSSILLNELKQTGNFNNLLKLIKDSLEKYTSLPNTDFVEKYNLLANNSSKRRPISNFNTSIELFKDNHIYFLKNLNSLRLQKQNKTSDLTETDLDNAKTYLKSMYVSLDMIQNMGILPVKFSISSNEINKIQDTSHFSAHFLGYIAAEKYLKDDPNFLVMVPSLFKLPNEAIEKRFMKKELFAEFNELMHKQSKKYNGNNFNG